MTWKSTKRAAHVIQAVKKAGSRIHGSIRMKGARYEGEKKEVRET